MVIIAIGWNTDPNIAGQILVLQTGKSQVRMPPTELRSNEAGDGEYWDFVTVNYNHYYLQVCHPASLWPPRRSTPGLLTFVTVASTSPKLYPCLLSGFIAEKDSQVSTLARKNNLTFRFYYEA